MIRHVSFALPCKIGEKAAKYIFAVTTASEFRNKGYASELIEQIKQEDDSILILRPVNDGLIPFYEKLGFCCFNATDKKGELSLQPLDGYEKLARPTRLNLSFVRFYLPPVLSGALR